MAFEELYDSRVERPRQKTSVRDGSHAEDVHVFAMVEGHMLPQT